MALISPPGTDTVDRQDSKTKMLSEVNPGWRNFFVAAYNMLTGLTQSGTTAQRPTDYLWDGRMYWDTTLGEPVFFNGVGWVTTPRSMATPPFFGSDVEDGRDSYVPGPQGAQGVPGGSGMPGRDGEDADTAIFVPPANLPTNGTYTPVLTNVANLDGSTAYECQYIAVGSTVTVSGRVDANPTAGAASTQLGISLPVASNIGAAEDCAGTAFCPTIAGQGAAILGDLTNNRAQMEWVAGDVTNQPMYFTFTYAIL